MDNDVLDWSRRLGWRLTDSRRAVLKAILSMNGYLDADEIVARAQRFDAGASRATVYRALPQLCEAGLLRKTDVGEGAVRFSRATPGEPCQHCPEEALARLPPPGAEKAQRDLARSLVAG